jgi:sulfur carrier protein
MSIEIQLNGKPQVIEAEESLSQFLARTATSSTPMGVAVALNGRVIRMVDWPQTMLKAGDQIEIVTAQQGG